MKKIPFYALLIVYTCFGLARGGSALVPPVNDLILHCAGYALIMVAAIFAYNKYHLPWFGFLFAYSVLIECVQYLLPYRTFSAADILANLAGLAAGLVLCVHFTPARVNRKAVAASGAPSAHEQG